MERDFNGRIEREPKGAQAMVEEQPEGNEPDVWDSILDTYRKIKAAKPEERSEKARRFAVVLTEYEKVMSYYLIMCSNDDFVG